MAKRPGPRMDLVPLTLHLDIAEEDPDDEPLEAYERLLLDVMRGDQTLFTRADEVDRLWQVCQPVLDNPPPTLPYARGSWGPTTAIDLAARKGGGCPMPDDWPADRGPRPDRRPAHLRAGRHRRHRSTGSARRASTRPASSARSSTPSAAAAGRLAPTGEVVAHPAVLLPRHRHPGHPVPHRPTASPRCTTSCPCSGAATPTTASGWSAGSAACAARSRMRMRVDARPDYGARAVRRRGQSSDGVLITGDGVRLGLGASVDLTIEEATTTRASARKSNCPKATARCSCSRCSTATTSRRATPST